VYQYIGLIYPSTKQLNKQLTRLFNYGKVTQHVLALTEPSSGDTIYEVIKHWIVTAMDPYYKCYAFYKIIYKMICRIIYIVIYALCMTSVNSLQGMYSVVLIYRFYISINTTIE
jgi:hypothetical protein